MDYLLSKKCFCGLCGKMLHGAYGTGHTGKKYAYYRCPGKGCELKPFKKEELEDLVVDQTCQEILTDEMIEKLTKKLMEIQEADRQKDPASLLRKELEGLKKSQGISSGR